MPCPSSVKRNFTLFALVMFSNTAQAQTATLQSLSGTGKDTLELHEVQVGLYEQQRTLNETPAAINVIGKEQLERFGNTGILSAMNASPGVRMEERSPGSYRFSIRGSSLRSPFGVRNVKVYYNGIPVTDPGGFSYFNQLGVLNITNVQVLKGPGSSVYGAGNGGVLLIGSMPEEWTKGISAGTTSGNYNLNRSFAELRLGDSSARNFIRYERLSSDGYRQHSALRKDMISYDVKLRAGPKITCSVHMLYNALEYETPGALTRKEYDANPSVARPATGATPGAADQDARIMQRNLLLGMVMKSDISAYWQNTTSLYGLYSRLENPAIRNYSKTVDPHFGGRSVLQYYSKVFRAVIGIEAQQSYATTGVYRNNKGVRDTLISNDEMGSSNLLGFAQLSWQRGRWTIEGGAGLSSYIVTIKRLSVPDAGIRTPYASQLSPRFAVGYRIQKNASLYLNAARGYSCPTTAELSPSGSAINPALSAEYGWNYETGGRGTLLEGKLLYDASIFFYTLSQAIVLRKDSAGGDSYINAGGTKQSGLEARLEYRVWNRPFAFCSRAGVWASYTGYHFRYAGFIQDADDFSGKRLPGTADHTIAAGMDLQLKRRFSLHVTYYFYGKTALNDANTEFADSYHLLGLKCSYATLSGKLRPELFAGADNLLNQRYSLGNDINAAGGRYFNAAVPVNFYAGFILHWLP